MVPRGWTWTDWWGAKGRIFTRPPGKVLRGSVFEHYVQEQGRRPREEVRAVPETGRGVIVLVEALLLAQRDDGISQSLGLFLVAAAF